MYNGKSILAIIPAKGNSRGIPGKNIKPLGEKPLLQWTTDSALKSEYLDEIAVSTDDRKIADLAQKLNVKVPVMRPKHLASDEAKSSDVILHIMNHYEQQLGLVFDWVMMLQATCPFRTHGDIDASIRFFDEQAGNSLISFCEAKMNPCWMATKRRDNTYELLIPPNPEFHQRQGLPAFYHKNGSIYLSTWESFRLKKDFESPETLMFEMDASMSVDLDDMDDWRLAEFLVKKRKLS